MGKKVDTEPVRIDKDLMNKLRKRIIQNDVDGKVYGKLSKTVEKAIEEYLSKDEKENLSEKLKNFMSDIDPGIIDDILEFLLDSDCLNEKGKILREQFLENYMM